MKVKLNPAIEGMSGQLGDLVFRELRGKTVVSRKPAVTAEPTAGQTAHRERFKLAATYGKSVMGDEGVRAVYEEAAKRKNVPVFSLTVADYFNAPTIQNVDYSMYDGKVGSYLTIHATDDFEVAHVHISLKDTLGNAIESGNAVEESGHWRYTATANVPNGAEVVLQVTATDRPGGTAVQTINF